MEYKGRTLNGRDIATIELLDEIRAYFDEDGAALNALALGGVNATSYALKADVDKSIADLVGAAPEALDTLYEISAVLQENVAEIDTILTQIGTKASQEDLDSAVDRITALEDNPSLTYENIVLALDYVPLDEALFTKTGIKQVLGIRDWALSANPPSYLFSDILDPPTTLEGYGITDAYTQSEVDNLLEGYLGKSDNAASASKLYDNTEYTVWGRTFFKNGKPVKVTSSPIFTRNGGFYAYNYNDVSTMLMWYLSDSTHSEFILGHKSSENKERTRICGYPISFHIGKYTNTNGVPLTPAMLIDADGNVTIEGNLCVNGTIASGGKAEEGDSALADLEERVARLESLIS